MKERKLGLAKRLSAFALAFVMVFSLLATVNVSALAADDNEPTLNPGWTYDGNAQDLILVPGESDDDEYAMYYYMTTDEDEEPLEPTSYYQGDWTMNWRDDDLFVQSNADDYYIWYCTFDEETGDVDVEPTLAGVVTVEAATLPHIDPVANNKKATADELEAGVSLIQDATGTVLFDYQDYGAMKFAVTDTNTTKPDALTLTSLEDNRTVLTVHKAGEYYVWYQVEANDNTDNYVGDSTAQKIEVTITEDKLEFVVPTVMTKQTAEYTGVDQTIKPLDDPSWEGSGVKIYDTTTPVPQELDTAAATIKYGISSNKVEYSFAELQQKYGTNISAKNATNKAKIYYTIEQEGYNTAKGSIELTITKAKATIDKPEVDDTNLGHFTAGAVVDGTGLYQATTQTSKPGVSSKNWKEADGNDDIDLTSQFTKSGVYYVYYMAKSDNAANISNSDVNYITVVAGVGSTGVTAISVVDPNEIFEEEPAVAAGDADPLYADYTDIQWTGKSQSLLSSLGAAKTGTSIEFCVKEGLESSDNANMPTATDDWFKTTNLATDKLTKSAIGYYTVWYRGKDTDGNTTTPVPLFVGITTRTATAGESLGDDVDYIVPAAPETATWGWSGKSSKLTTEGKAKSGLFWVYQTFRTTNAETDFEKTELYSLGFSVPKASEVGTYTTNAFLVDTSGNYDGTTFPCPVYTYLLNSKGISGNVVKIVSNVTATIEQLNEPTVTEPEINRDELVYDGTTKKLVTSSGKTSAGKLYVVVTKQDEEGNTHLISLDGTAVDAGDYEVSTLVTDLDPLAIAMGVSIYGYDGALGLAALQSNVFSQGNVGTVTIDKGTPIVMGVEALSQEETGGYVDLATEGLTSGGQIYYRAVDEDDEVVFSDDADGWRITPMAKEIGEYTISYRVQGDDNWDDLDWVTLTDKAQIAAGKAEVTTKPEGLGYNADGTAKPLVTAGEAEDGTMVYALGTMLEPVTDWSAEIPTATEEGTYYVWYRAKGDEGFADSDKDFVVATIGHEAELYRIFNPASGEHIYTYDEAEVANATQNLGWTLDGTVSGTSEGSIPVHRLENLMNPGVHIYSTDDNEIATLVAAGVAKYEGVQFMTVPQGPGTQDYYRLSSPSFPHHYTADQNEINSLIASGVYTLDGYAWSFPQ